MPGGKQTSIVGILVAACWAMGILGSGIATDFTAASDRASIQILTDDPVPGLDIVDENKEHLHCSHVARAILGLPPGGPQSGLLLEALSDTDVTHYFLDIEIIPEYSGDTVTAVRVEGESTISVDSLTNGLTEFTVNLSSNMTVDDVTGDVSGWTHDGDDIEVTLDQAYDAGESFQMGVAYSGYPTSGGFGAFKWWYRDENIVVATLSEPYYARTWWACKDSLGDKATMQMHCTVPDGMVAVSNGVAGKHAPLSGERIQYRWHEINPMVPYLASLAITNYEQYDLVYTYDDGGPKTMPVPCYVYPDHWNYGLDQPETLYKSGCDELPDMLEKLTVRYGPYPFLNEKYGVVETGGSGGFGSSMEHQTISSMNRVNNFSDIMCHELAHQWWGDDVTCATWYDIWLNEGWASYSESLYRELMASGGMSSYWSRMNSRRPLDPDAQVYRTSIGSVGAIFSGNDVYNKGSWVPHMLRHVLGTEAFFEAVAHYRADYSGSFATTDQFAASISASFGHDLSWFTDQWVMNPGSPDYQWNYTSEMIDGQEYLKLTIWQQQDVQGFGLITMPIDIPVTTASGTTVHKVWNDAWTEYYVIPLDGLPISVAFDTEDGYSNRNWILFDTLTKVTTAVEGPPVIVSAEIEPLSGGTASTVIRLVLSEDIDDFEASDIHLQGDLTGSHVPANVNYVSVGRVATVTYENLPNDGFTFTVLADGVVANGHSLDGEIDNSDWWDDDLLPSGDGQPGGNAVLAFTILAGDADCDGFVSLQDVDEFVSVLLGLDIDECHGLRVDMDNNLSADGDDVQLFLNALVSE